MAFSLRPCPPNRSCAEQLSPGPGDLPPCCCSADPGAAAKIAPADAVRTQRALEVLYASGQPMSSQATAAPPPWRVLELGLDPANLRQRIQQRTDQLYADGLVEETRQLAERYGADLPLLQTIGYGEALQVMAAAMAQPEGGADHQPTHPPVRQATAHLVPASAQPPLAGAGYRTGCDDVDRAASKVKDADVVNIELSASVPVSA